VAKPAGWTSFDVVARIRRLTGVRKVGHAGTLDPAATGLLIVCTGAATRTVDGFLGLDKEYLVTMLLGARTASHDADTPVIEERSTAGVTEDAVRTALAAAAGPQLQRPPMHSAVKVRGRRLYELARKGMEVERAAREIVIREIAPVALQLPQVQFRMRCSKGTYVRTLVDDLGLRLGCGAYVTALERTAIGAYRLEDALTLADLERMTVPRGGAAA
jgi:tRNA pseudouridine55 synthase